MFSFLYIDPAVDHSSSDIMENVEELSKQEEGTRALISNITIQNTCMLLLCIKMH